MAFTTLSALDCDDVYAASKAPAITKIVSTDSYVKLSWQNKRGTSRYYVYRKTGLSGKYRRIASLKSRTYVDRSIKTGNRYYYKVASKYTFRTYTGKPRRVTPVSINAPGLISVKRYNYNGSTRAQLTWNSQKGLDYYVYRKAEGERWERMGSVKATGSTAYFRDYHPDPKKKYTYTCKVVRKIGPILFKYGSYDNGIKALYGKPSVDADCGNLKADITWDSISGADKYKVYRKLGRNGSYRCIGTTTSTSFSDVYRNTATSDNERSWLMAEGTFVDPSINPFVYTVRAIDENGIEESYTDYYRDGDFHMEAPPIVSVDKISSDTAEIEWGTQSNAVEYYIYSGKPGPGDSIKWKFETKVKDKPGTRMKVRVDVEP